MKKKIIIMGGGFAGLRAYYRLDDHTQYFDITVIDKRKELLEKPALPEVAFAGKPVGQVLIDLKPVIENKGGTYINAAITHINAEKNEVSLDDGTTLGYDYLIIASGAKKDYGAIEGMEEHGYSMCDDAHAIKLWEAIKKFGGGDIVIGAAKSIFGSRVDAPKLLAPCEGPIGEAMFMLDHDLRKRHLREKSTIKVFTPGEIFFEDIGDHVRNKVGAVMGKRSISLFNNKVVKKITENTISFEDGSTMSCDLAIIIPPYKALPLFSESNLGDDQGFIPTDKTMKHLDYDNIYAVGDINALAQPKLGHIAIMQADIAASAIIKKETGKGEVKKYEPSIFCIMNMGGPDATLIYSDNLYGGENDLAFHSPMARMMKWSFDSYYFFTQGHMPPDFAMSGMEMFLSLFKEDKDKYIALND